MCLLQNSTCSKKMGMTIFGLSQLIITAVEVIVYATGTKNTAINKYDGEQRKQAIRERVCY